MGNARFLDDVELKRKIRPLRMFVEEEFISHPSIAINNDRLRDIVQDAIQDNDEQFLLKIKKLLLKRKVDNLKKKCQ